MTRYLSGLCVAGLGLCGGGWLIVAAVVSGGEFTGLPGQVNLLTGVGLVVVSCVSLGCWATAWRRRMRVDGVLTDRFLIATRRQARRQARRNRCGLRRDAGRTTRLAKRSTRESRRAARRSARLARAGGDVLSSGAGLGSAPGGDGSYSVTVPAPLTVPLHAVPPQVTDSAEADGPAPAVPPLPLPRRTPRPASRPAPASPVPPLTVPLADPLADPPAAPPVDGDELMFAADGEEAWW